MRNRDFYLKCPDGGDVAIPYCAAHTLNHYGYQDLYVWTGDPFEQSVPLQCLTRVDLNSFCFEEDLLRNPELWAVPCFTLNTVREPYYDPSGNLWERIEDDQGRPWLVIRGALDVPGFTLPAHPDDCPIH